MKIERWNHVIVHYRGIDNDIYHASMFNDEAACVQHYSDIYKGLWPCGGGGT